MTVEYYSGIGANTPMTGFGGTSGFGSPNFNSNFNSTPLGTGFPSYSQSGGTSGGGFGNFLNSNFMSNVGGPLLSAGLSGIFTNRAADNYGQSAREAAFLGGQAALLAGREAGAFSLLGEELAQQRRYEDAAFQLDLQTGPQYQDARTREMGMQMAAQDSPGSMARAGRYMTMFG
tara:strand:+ start:1038 stop:1562 length:525 start_codon:yes stop_codon:yes gene_type:complete